jgi:hypothetical protein
MFKNILLAVVVLVGVSGVTYEPVFASETTATTSLSGLVVAPAAKFTPTEIEAKVRTYFADTPVMIEIARCESKFRQFTDAGNVFYGGAGGGMVGIFQFFESIHKAPALALGFDLATVEGNLGYAKHLYSEQGTTPWRSCVPATPILDATTQQRIALMKQIIGLLQQLLALKLAEE